MCYILRFSAVSYITLNKPLVAKGMYLLFYRIKNAVYRFMMGRYGIDSLSICLLLCYLAVSLINTVVTRIAGSVVFYTIASLISAALCVLIIFRTLSRDIYRRQKENARYLNFKSSVSRRFYLLRRRFKDRKIRVYRTCPSCRAVLRLPKKKGKHTCVCPNCKTEFSVRVM